MKIKNLIKLVLFAVIIFGGGGKLFTKDVRAAIGEPCKVCNGSVCETIDVPPACSNVLNECSSNSGCVPSCTPSCSCAKTTCDTTTCSDGCGGRCDGTKICGGTTCTECRQDASLATCQGLGLCPTPTPTASPTPGGGSTGGSGSYCVDRCVPSCSPGNGNNLIQCWPSYDDYVNGTNKITPDDCRTNTACNNNGTCPSGETYLPKSGACCLDQNITPQGDCCHPVTTNNCAGGTTPPPGGGGGGACISPDKPAPQIPIGGITIATASSSMTWSATANWGEGATSVMPRTYAICASQTSTNTCAGTNAWGANVTGGNNPPTSKNFTPSVGGTYYWRMQAINTCGAASGWTATNNFCFEGFSATDPKYVSAWGACSNGTHTRTRTCIEDCGTDDCTGVSLVEDCLGTVRGTLFDASDLSACPAFDAGTGYATGLPVGTGIATQTFGLTDTNAVAPHPWTPLSPITTDANGNYNINLNVPANYQYDFAALAGKYSVDGGPKLTCVSNIATMASNDPVCTTQPCTILNGMSFGFWKMYTGWWQAVGGNIYAGGGIKSEIPSGLLTEMSLILPDTTMGNKRGFLSYGIPKASDMLGTNPNAKVSAVLWERESKYDGPHYDWSYYNNRFNLFDKTTWGDGQPVNYDDLGVGYQIFKSDESITSFDFNPTGTQKAIFHINGDVRVTSNIVVPSGAFLAVIAKGTITFDPSVSQADGWYVANKISVPCEDIGSDGCDKTDTQFLGNGSFIGWGSVSLGRDRGAANNTASAEKFTYRQDLYLNAPKAMKIYTKYYKPFVP